MIKMRKAIEVGKVRYSQRKGNHSGRLECRVNEGNSGKYRQKRSNVGSTIEGLEYQIGESIIKCLAKYLRQRLFQYVFAIPIAVRCSMLGYRVSLQYSQGIQWVIKLFFD